MIELLPNLEPRLQRRYQQLVKEHLHANETVASGLRAVFDSNTAFASTQAAWRFYKNPRVSLKTLAEPLLSYASQAVSESCSNYVLVIHDWSNLIYCTHPSKVDRIPVNQKKALGYDLQTALLVSDRFGTPLTSVYQELRSSEGIHSTRFEEMSSASGTKLDRLLPAMKFVNALDLGKPTVHLVDSEADSVGHYRDWTAENIKWIVRGDECRIVNYNEKNVLIKEVSKKLQQEGAFHFVKERNFQGKKVKQYVAETKVLLERPAKQHRRVNGVEKWKTVPGPALHIRLILSQLRGEKGEILAKWYLFSNLSEEVSSETIALWYYWRWQIESFFKLLKGAGHHLEEWQQENGKAIAKRLLVATMACVLVWQIARSEEPKAEQAREILTRLSGRQMKKSKPHTEPAMLAGLWVFLSALDLLEQYKVSELQQIRQNILPKSFQGDVFK